MSLFSLLPLSAWGAREGFVFNTAEAISGWRFEHVNEARFTGGGLLLEGNDNVMIGPPAGFRGPARRVAMELRFKTPTSLIFNVRVRAADGWEAARTLRVKALRGGDEVTVLRLYLGRTGGAANYIDNFGIAFSGGEKIEVRLDSLRFYEPTAPGLASLYWEEFWRPDFITGTTVGYVSTPEAGGLGFISMLYIFIGLAFISLLVLFRARGRGLSTRNGAKTLVILFLFAGVLFAVRMDYNWLSIFRDDVKTLSKVDVKERIRLVNYRSLGGLLDFIDFVKGTVPSGKSIRPAIAGHDTPLAAIARYYMLPLEDSEEALFLWSYGEALRLDRASGALYDLDGKVVAPKAGLFAKFSENAAIYEVIK